MKKILTYLILILCFNTGHANTVNLIVPVGPGASMDDIARTIAPALSKRLEKTVIVENKPGASGSIGMEYVAKSPGDGLTLVITNNGLLNINPMLNANSGYKSSSFVSIGLIGNWPLVLTTGALIPATNLKELIDYIKNNPGTASWASPGIGTNLHLLGELMKIQYNLDMVHIIYKGMSQAMIDVSEGRVTMFFDLPNSKMLGLFEMNKLKPIVVTGPTRIATLPNTPTAIEQGYPFLNAQGWAGISVPSSTPESILTPLRIAFAETLEDPEVKSKLRLLGVIPSNVKTYNSQKFINDEKDKWSYVIKKSNIKIE